MDPNETLHIFRERAADYQRALAANDADAAEANAIEAMHAAEDLDEWLSRGGFLPKAWSDSLSRPGESFRP